MGDELLDERADLIASPAIEAGRLACRAVQFEHLVAASHLMQPVDVLSDYATDPAGGFPAGQNFVARVRLRRSELAVHLAFLPPVFVAGLGTFEEFSVIDGPILRPDTARRAEVGD